MSYCRFSSGDVYLYPSIYGGIVCCSCRLASKVPTIFTKGLGKDDLRSKLFGKIEPCKHCGGVGCDKCMGWGDTTLATRSEAINHLKEHRKAGHYFPAYALKDLRQELKELGETGGIEKPDEPPSPFLDITTGKRITLDELLSDKESSHDRPRE